MKRALLNLNRVVVSFGQILPVFLLTLVSLNVKAQCPPILTATPASANVCAGDSVLMACMPNSGVTWQWYKDGIIMPGETDSICYAYDAGNYTVMVGGCPTPSNPITVTIKPLPYLNIAATATQLCSGQPVSLFVTTSPNVVWVWIDPNTIFGTNTNPLTTTLTATESFQLVGADQTTNCANTVGVTITVFPEVTPGSVQANSQICPGQTPPLLTSTPPTGGTGVYTYQWQSSTTSASAGFSNIPGAVGTTYQPGPTSVTTWFRMIVSSPPCDPEFTNAVMVQVNPNPTVTSAGTKSICTGDNVNYIPTSNVVGTTFTWTASLTSGTVTGFSVSGAGNINDVLSLPAASAVSGQVTYVITPTGPAPSSCPGIPRNLVVTVYPIPLVTNAVLSQTICAGSTTTAVPLTSNIAGATFTWTATATAGLTGYQASGTGDIPAMQINSLLASPGLVTYTIVPHGPGVTCPIGPSVTYTINVDASPSVTNNPMQQTICTGNQTTAVTLTSNIPATTYTWTATATPGISGFLASGTNTIPIQTIANSTNTQGIVTYHIIPNPSLNGCAGIPRDYQVRVNPEPVVSVAQTVVTLCSGSTTSIALTSNVAGTTFSWTASGPGSLSGFSAGSGSLIAQTILNNSNAPHDVTYVITPTANGCAGSPITVTVTVNPAQVLSIVPSSPATCSGGNVVINLVGNVSGIAFTWTASAVGNVTGFSNGSGSTISQTLVNNDNVTRQVVYSVMMSLNGCTAGPSNFNVTVYPQAAVTTVPTTATICSGSAFNLALTSNVAGATYTWTANSTVGVSGFSGGSGNSINQTIINSTNAPASVTYTVTPSANGCPGTPRDYTVTVNPIPDLTLSLANQTICSGTAITPVTFSSSVVGTTYLWTATPSGAGITGYIASGAALIPAQVINSTLSVQGTVTYTVTPRYATCNGTSTGHVVTINPLPTVSNASMAQTVCNGGTSANVNLLSNVAGTTFTWTATASSAAITGFLPSGGNTIPSQTLSNSSTVAETVTYHVIPTSNFGPNCDGTPRDYIITVNPSPVVTSSLTQAVCSGQPFNYTITSNLVGSSYTWSRAAVAGISNPAAAGSTAGINETLINTTNVDINVQYLLTPIGQAPTFCSGTTETLTVTVRALPQVNAGSDMTIPYGIYTTLAGSASGGTGALTYAWTPNTYLSSGANTLTPQTTNLIINRTYTLAVTDAAGCSTSDMMTVYVVGTPIASVPISTPTDICVGESATINANVTGGSGTYTYTWTSNPVGFTATGATITVWPMITTEYIVVADDGFNSTTASVMVTVHPLPLQYVLTGGGSYCIGGSGVVVGMAGSQSGVNYQLYNNGNPVGVPVSGNGSAISFGNQTLAGIYTVTATTVATGCVQSMGSSVTVSINSLPVANAGADQTIPYGTSTTLSGSVSGGFGVMSYAWTPAAFIASGGNTSTPSTTNIYSNTTFNLAVTDANGCVGTDDMSVSLTGNAVNVVVSATPLQICADTNSAQLTTSVTGGSGTYTYSWTSIPAGSPVWTSNDPSPVVSPDVTTIYTVTANDGFNTAIASVTVIVHPLPLQYSVTGGGSYCYAGPGVNIGLSGSELNTNYQLYRGGVPDGPAVTGTGNPLSFGNRTAAFSYTVIATNNITGCTSAMNGNATIIILPPPLQYLVTGGGSYPLGGPGREVGLMYGDAGVSYQLYCNNIAVGTPVAGSAAPLSFGLQTQAGIYTVVGTDIATGCTTDMNGSVEIYILANPIIYQVTGGGVICFGEPGLPVGLTGSEAGINYQLYFDGFPRGPIMAGTNFPLFWGPFTDAGLYEVQAVNSAFGTTMMMQDSAVIVVNPLPTIFTMNPVGSQCPGTIIRLNGSDFGVNYYLAINGITIDTMAGTGLIGFLDFGPKFMSGTYTIKAINPVTGCEAKMNGSTIINIAPQIYNVLPAGILCPGQEISLSGSQLGVNYQLRRNGTFDMGAPVPGTGGSIIMGNASLYGTYSVVAINATTNCVSYMNDSATLYPDPTAFTIVPDGVACEGDLIGLNGSEIGVDYVLLLENAIHVDTISGTGSPISFGPQLIAGNYTILAVSQTSYCIYTMNGSTVLNDAPLKHSLTPAGIQCIGTTLGLTGSQTGISYQLILDGIYSIGLPVAGDGNAISFGIQSLPGTYTVRAVNDITGCNSMMIDSAILDPLPAVFAITPEGTFCAGTSVMLSGSELNFSYILVLNGSVNIDTIAGTGTSVNFGPQTISGTYSVLAYNPVTHCTLPMTGSTVIEPLPAIYNITPAGFVCQGSVIGLDNSESGTSYQLRRDGTLNVGAPVIGTGSAIDFGVQILTGTYTVIATGINGCVSNMSGSVIINSLPAEFSVSPAASICAGSPIGLTGSEINTNYILVLDGSIHIDTIPGTGTPISFGTQITSGVYTVYAYNTITNCMSNMADSAVVTVAPIAYNMTPAGVACDGSALGLENSEIGVTYQLRWNGATNIGTPVAGTGAAISFGPQTLEGIYSVVATNTNGCFGPMNSTVEIYPLPVAFNLVPSGTQCQGTTLGLDGSEVNASYILVLDGSIMMDTIPGVGSPITFGPQLTSGNYSVIAFFNATGCSSAMNGATTISNVAPAIYSMTPAGIICAGTNLGLDNSEIGALYQLRRDGTINVGAQVSGTGSPISFGVQTLPGEYTVIATNVNGCNSTMSGSVIVNPNPTAYTIAPSGMFCPGISLGTDGSESGINYVLVLDGGINIDTLAGTGSPLSFGPQTTSGTYTVIAFDALTLCQTTMNSTAVINPSPVAFSMTPAGIICAGTSLGLDNSEIGVTYQLRRNGSINMGSPVAGTGSAISFGAQTLAGTYTVIATNTFNCSMQMTGNVVLNPAPIAFNITPAGVHCQGTVIGIDGTETGVDYILVLNNSIHIDTIAGTGSAITFGAQSTSGNYTIIARSAAACELVMNGITTINPAPYVFNITPAGVSCAGVNIGTDGSNAGVNYQLRRDGFINVGSAVAGTGFPLSFGVQTVAGTYTVEAAGSNSCTAMMNGNVVVNTTPLAFTLLPAGTHCPGTVMTLNGSEAGIDYILYRDGMFPIDTIPGTGSVLSFGSPMIAGNYTVKAVATSSLCETTMNGTTTILVAPTVYNVIPAGIICSGTAVGTDDSEPGVYYQLRRNGITNVGAPIAGTGSALDFGVMTIAGTYTVVATSISNTCGITMNGSAVLQPMPMVYSIFPQGMQCAGTSLSLNGSQAGTDYVLVLDNTFNLDTLAGTGGVLNFGPQSITGTYTIEAIGGASSCQAVMTGTAQIMAAPATFNITPAGLTCAPALLGLDGSEAGVDYTLFKNGFTTGITVSGTGMPVLFGVQNFGEYTVKAVDQTSHCSVFMTGTVTLGEPATVNAGIDVTICATQTAMLNASVTNSSSAWWSTTGDGIFNDINSLTAIYTPGVADAAAGHVDLILTAFGTGSCIATSVNDTMSVTIDQPATANAGGNIDVCSDSDYTISGATASNFNSVTWTSSGTGTFANANTLIPTYTPSADDFTAGSVVITMLVNGNAPCSNNAIDVIIMTFHPIATADAGSNGTICEGSTFTVSDATATNYQSVSWSTSGDGLFGAANTLSPTYIPGSADIASGSVQLIMNVTSAAPCSDHLYDTVTVTIIPAPVSNAGADVNVCESTSLNISDASVTNSTSQVWHTSGTGVFSDTTIINPVYIPSAADIASGSVVLSLTVNGNSLCSPVTDTKNVNFILNSIVNAGADAHMCTTAYTISGASAGNYSSLTWAVQTGTGTISNASSLTPVFTPSATDITNGFVILSLTGNPLSPCTNAAVDYITLFIDQSPVVNAGADISTCTNTTFTITDATSTSFTSLLWSTSGTGTFAFGNTLNAEYTPSLSDLSSGSVILTLAASNDGCGTFTDTKLVNFINHTVVSAGNDTTICEGNSLAVQGASAVSFSSIFWTTSGTGTFAAGNSTTPVYTPGAADILAGTVTLTFNAVSVAPCGNTISDNLVLSIQRRPVVSAGSDALICSSDVYNNADGSVSNSSTFAWTTSGSGSFSNANTLINTYIPSAGDITNGNVTLTLTASNNAACPDITDQKVISFMPAPVADAGPSATICTSCVFVAASASAANSTSVLWQTSGSGAFNNATLLNTTYTPSAADYAQGSVILTLVANASAPCTQTTDTMTLYFSYNPGIDFSWAAACDNQPVTFSVNETITNVGAVASWLWNFGDGNTSLQMNPSHAFPALGTYNVTLTAIDTLGSAKVISHQVTVSQLPVAFFTYNMPNCSNQEVLFTDLSHTLYGNISEWIWNFGDGSDNDTIQFPDQPNTGHLYNAIGIFNVSLTITNSFGCKASVIIPVDVIEAPVANFQSAGNCSGLETAFTDASFANGPGNTVQYWWDFGDPATGVNNTSDIKDATHLFSAPGTYQVMHVVRNYNNCTDTIVKSINILTPAAVDFVYDHTCADGQSNFAPDTTVMDVLTISNWHWDFGDGITSNQQVTSHIYDTPGMYKVSLTVTDTAGCPSTKARNIEVFPAPVAMFNADQLPCEDSPVHFDDVSSTYTGFITEWTWNFGDGNIQQIQYPGNSDVDHTYASGGTYQVILSVKTSDSCTAETIQTIVVNQAPTSNFSYDNACQLTAIQFTDQTQTGSAGTISGWNWNFGDFASGAYNTSTLQNPTHTYNTTGTYQVTLITTTANGCESTIVKTIVVTEAPFVDFTYNNHCVATGIQFSPASGVNAAGVTSWNWNFGDGTFAYTANPVHTFTTPGNHNVTLTITTASGCSNTKQHTLFIIPAPVANFSTSSPSCSGTEILFTNLSGTAYGNIVSWEYNFGDGNTTTVNYPGNPSVTHVYATYGSYTVTLTVTTSDDCQATVTRIVQVLQSPLANFTVDVSCSTVPAQFTDLSQGNAISWLWNFGDYGSGSANTSNMQNPVHTFMQAGDYQVKLYVQSANGCNDTVTQTINVAPKPVVDFSHSNGCAADTVHFISSTFVNTTSTASWYWEFGDSQISTDADPYHVYAAPGTYTVTLTITNQNGCTNSKTRQVQVTAPPVAMFNSTNSSCSGTAVLFSDLSSTPNGSISTWTWDFGDGTIVSINAPSNPNVSHTYTTSGIYDIVLTISTTTGCEAYSTKAITIHDVPATAFSFAGVCNGLPTMFTDLSQSANANGITSWNWNFGDPASGVNNTSTLSDPQHLFSGTGSFDVTLTTENSNGCTSSAMQTLVIAPAPAVDFTSTPACDGEPVTFAADPAVTNIPDVASYLWDFGDGSATSALATPDHLYAQTGDYTVTLTITNTTGCANSISHEVSVKSLPVAQFTSNGNCVSNYVQFTDNSFNPSGDDIVSWFWDFGVSTSSNDTSSLQNPTYVYTVAGNYNVTLTITNEAGCTDVKVMQIAVIPAPAAEYSYIAEPCHNGSVLFTDESVSNQSTITNWYWEFAPGVYSTLQNPVHVFGNSDTCFNVKLVVTTINGCTDTIIKEVCIPSALDVDIDYTQTCIGETTWFIPTLVNPAGGNIETYNWDFGDPATGILNQSTLPNPEHKFSKAGTFVVSLLASDANNCSTTTYITVVVSKLPKADFSYSGGKCDSLVSFTDLTTDATIAHWNWNFGDGNTMVVDNPLTGDVEHFYPYPGIYEVTLITESISGCYDTIVKTIRRTPCMSAEFAVNDTIVCQKRSMKFTESSTCQAPIASWTWYFGDGTSASYTSAQPFVEHTYATAGKYTARLVISTQMVGGMETDTASNQVVVKPAAKAAFQWQDVCLGKKTEFGNLTNNNNTTISKYFWSFGDPGSSTDTTEVKHPEYEYGIAGEFDVKLVVTNTLGCTDTIVNKVNIYQNPVADFTWNNACEAKPVEFTDNSDTTNSAIVKWNWIFKNEDEILGASVQPRCSYSFAQAGIFDAELTVTDRNGCATSVTKQVPINSSPVAAFSIVENYENKQGQVMITNGTINGTNYEWDLGNGQTTGVMSPITSYDKEGHYDIKLITWNGDYCSDTLTVGYDLLYKGLFVPNAFNPGHMNSEVAVFKPKGTNLKTYLIEIYDRWGNLVWTSNKIDASGSPAEGWDGTIHGNVLKEDVYLWKISARFLDGEIWDGSNMGNNENMPQTKTGTVTLIR